MSFEAIPNYTELRRGKNGYDTRFEIDTEHPLYQDPLVDPREADFGFDDAKSYYAKPNKMTGEKLPGVPDVPLVRLDVMKRLVRAEKYLRSDPDVRDALGVPARLRIDDALRPHQVQVFAYEVAWPTVIRRANNMSPEEEIPEDLLRKYIAKPAKNPTPTPHLTGGAVDVTLVNMGTNKGFDRGHTSGKTKGTAYPDFHEGYHLNLGESDIEDTGEQEEVAPPSSEVVLSRRILYYAMTKIGGLSVNPTEVWHYGKGDPLSEYVAGSNRPYYDVAELPSWYEGEMARLQSQG